ncbi:MAG: UvrD-helicase domain-containing protein, partial [Clostridia bacterium]|nr:UvrD-helicase domain-containing protein [Clostridia bacterium]
MAEMTTTVDKKQKTGERKWTEAQRSAIDVRDKTLLVSAAAGSGKTAVLTERIVKTVTDKDDPVGIDRLLIVTFTTAAAAEMRERISAVVKRESALHPEDAHLSRQVLLLPSARIRTIDSFCNDVLRTCTDKVGISPSYRIGDDAELDLIGREVILGLIGAILDGDGTEEISSSELEALTDCLLPTKRIDKLADVFLKLYHDFSSTEGGVGTLYDLCR